MRFKLALLVSLLISLISVGQVTDPIMLPTIIPASPEVAQLGKVGSLSAGLHTGSANVNIPLYTLSQDKIKMDIALSYSSNGIKLDEIPGVAGLGWNLVAGGVVSRTVHDEPDGFYPYLPPPTNPYVKNQDMLTYLLNATKYGDTKDTEYDEYSYSFNGMSGKVFLNPSTGEGYCIPHNTFKVKVINHNGLESKNVEIRTPDGVLYKFGFVAREETRNISINGGSGLISKSGFFETAWFLDSVITPEGNRISFNYTAVTIRTTQGLFQTLIKPLLSAPGYGCGFNCSGTYSDQNGGNMIDYVTYRLTSIATDNGITVALSYGARPDISGDIRLNSLIVSSYTGGIAGTLKRYVFEYYDPVNNNSSINKRFFLSKIKTIDLPTGVEGIPEASLDHTFEYYEKENMGPRLSHAQDYFGYYNGANNAFFAPYVPSISSSVFNGSSGGNRDPGGDDKRNRGILTRVNYPTGGYEEFTYEPNYLLQSTSPNYSTQSIGGSGFGVYDPQTFVSSNFTCNSEQVAVLQLKCFKSPAFPDAPSGEGNIIFDFKLVKVSTSEVIVSRKFMVYTEENINVTLLDNTAYRMELIMRGEVNAGSATIQYNPQSNFINKDVGGLRVSKISSFDPVSGKTFNKHYKYKSFANLVSGWSSGVGAASTLNYLPYTSGTMICSGLEAQIAKCPGYMVSSSSLMPFYTFGGSHIAYTNVLEADDPDFKNGFVEHFFNTQYPGVVNTTTILGSSSLNTPTNINTDLNGTEYLTRYYKKMTDNTFKIVKEVANNFDLGAGIYNTRSDYIVRMRWEENHHYTPPSQDEFEGFDVLKYDYVSQWIKLSSTVTTDYDQNGANPVLTTVIYDYNNLNHLQPTRVETSLSDNTTQITENKYAHDFAQTSPINQYQKLVDNHQLNQVIEAKTLKDQKHINTVKTEMKVWDEDGSEQRLVIEPDFVSTLKGTLTTPDIRIRYHKVDVDGNVLEVSKEGGQRISYIYDYGNNFPVAEIKNASILANDEIAYTSFESDGKGYWTFTGATLWDNTVPTGTRCYSLSGGNISRAVSSGKTYILVYWLKNSSGSVSVNGVLSSKQLSTRNGWTAYELKISAVSTITISGSGTIDELRLHLAGSLMTTFTYAPNIGISSTSSANNVLTRYEYDGYYRLKLVRDGDRNIIKQYDYQYAQTYENSCTNTTPNWTATGNERCLRNSTDSNYTGEKAREEMDMNNCSASFLQLRWVVFATPPECAPVANCSGEGKKAMNGQCEMGVKIITYFEVIGSEFYCTYHYEWSDGTRSPDINAIGAGPCEAD